MSQKRNHSLLHSSSSRPRSSPVSLHIPIDTSTHLSTYHSETSNAPLKRRRTCKCQTFTVSPTAISTSPSAFATSSQTTTTNSIECDSNKINFPTPADKLPYPQHTTKAIETAINETNHANPQLACNNAATLSDMLSNIVSSLDQDGRTFWCQLMDTLATRSTTGDVKFSIPIAPCLLWKAEEIFARHADTLRESHKHGVDPSELCVTCGSFVDQPDTNDNNKNINDKKNKQKETNQIYKPMGATAREFGWVDDDIDDIKVNENGESATQKLAVGSFETYVSEVLDDTGKEEFIKQRFYGGAALDSRWLMRCFGASVDCTENNNEEGDHDVVTYDSSCDESNSDDSSSVESDISST